MTREAGPAAALRIKFTELLYVPWIWQWCSIHHSQADASRPANLCHPKRILPVEGELVCTFTGKFALEHKIVHLELPTMHKPLVIMLECLVVPCILKSYLPSLFVNKVNIIMPELVLHGFVVWLNTGGDHGDFWGGGG
jgi:hypothetical protein